MNWKLHNPFGTTAEKIIGFGLVCNVHNRMLIAKRANAVGLMVRQPITIHLGLLTKHVKIQSLNTTSLTDFADKFAAAINPQTIKTKAVFLEYNPSNHGRAEDRTIGMCPYRNNEKDISTVCKLKF